MRVEVYHPLDAVLVSDHVEALTAGGAESERALAAMMTMKKIDVAALDAARKG